MTQLEDDKMLSNQEGLRRLPSRFNPLFKKPVFEASIINIREMVAVSGFDEQSDRACDSARSVVASNKGSSSLFPRSVLD
jgi:hypothetical protein